VDLAFPLLLHCILRALIYRGSPLRAKREAIMTNRSTWAAAALAVALSTSAVSLYAQDQLGTRPMDKNMIPPSFTPPARTPAVPATKPDFDYEKRVVMLPMRDGTKLYTVIVIPKGVKNAPMLLTRTCYNAEARAHAARDPKAELTPAAAVRGAAPAAPAGRGTVKAPATHMVDELNLSDEVYVRDGYIRVYQDVRGKYGSEGVYLMTPPPVGPWNPTGADDTMDAYDTIDWLVKNVPESNGRVGMTGSSYEGFTVVMALLHPHPALKAAVPESPMVDGWMGDDWFQYGAFRQTNLDYFLSQTTARGAGIRVQREGVDEYTNFLSKGSTGDMARSLGEDQLPMWKMVEAHPAYDAYWQSQALDKLIGKTDLTVPTMWLQGLWDQEDMYGANHSYAAWEPKDKDNKLNYLVMGPWFHSQVNREGHSLGPLVWDTNTVADYLQNVQLPFFNTYLRDGAPKADTPPVYIYNTGEDHWDKFAKWPLSCDAGCDYKSKPLYLQADGKLGFESPKAGGEKFDEYVADPAKPVPFSPRPYTGDNWRTWLVTDQRFVDGRTDVMTYTTEPLTEPLRVSGVPKVNLVASTSGTDSDWVVKLIDVYPDGHAAPMGGYELPISMDIFRGRYRTSFEKAEALKSNEPLTYKWDMTNVNHVFQPGHRIMVQVQSSLFPLYDRNPQTFVPNIFDAKAGDYKKATQRIYHSGSTSTFISLPVVPVKLEGTNTASTR
jgi:putative CocE/NonD family hydrolase